MQEIDKILELRGGLTDERIRILVAQELFKNYRTQYRSISLTDIHSLINNKLADLGLPEVSYTFVKNCNNIAKNETRNK